MQTKTTKTCLETIKMRKNDIWKGGSYILSCQWFPIYNFSKYIFILLLKNKWSFKNFHQNRSGGKKISLAFNFLFSSFITISVFRWAKRTHVRRKVVLLSKQACRALVTFQQVLNWVKWNSSGKFFYLLNRFFFGGTFLSVVLQLKNLRL